jgi:predicted aspartyl protease
VILPARMNSQRHSCIWPLLSGVLLGLLPVVAAQAAENSTNAAPISIPIKFQRGHLMVPASVNGSNSLSFLLDTGYGINMIHPALVEPLGLTRAGRVTIIGIAGREEAGQYEGAVFDIGGVEYKPRRIASLPSEASMSRRRRDGVLGAGFFRRFVVEIDAKAATLRLHEPKTYEYAGRGESIPLSFKADTPIIDAAILFPDREAVRGQFEIDTGCDDYLCLGQEFVAVNRLLGEDTKAGVKQGVGGGAAIRHGTLPQLQMGTFTLEKVSANFFNDGSPAADGLAGHIGLAALKNYRVIFDYSRQRMILEKYP